MNYTKGPWHVNGAAIEAETDDGTAVLAHVYHYPDNGIDDAENKANARLMAGAPNLREALRNLEAEVSLQSGNLLEMPESLYRMMIHARAALTATE